MWGENFEASQDAFSSQPRISTISLFYGLAFCRRTIGTHRRARSTEMTVSKCGFHHAAHLVAHPGPKIFWICPQELSTVLPNDHPWSNSVYLPLKTLWTLKSAKYHCSLCKGGGGGALAESRVSVHVRLLRRESSTCGYVGWFPTRWVGFKKEKRLREVGSLLGYPTAGGSSFCCMGVGQLSRCSQVLLLPLGATPMPAPACSTQSLCPDSEGWTVLNTTDVGRVTWGQRVPDHQMLPISGAHVQALHTTGGTMIHGAERLCHKKPRKPLRKPVIAKKGCRCDVHCVAPMLRSSTQRSGLRINAGWFNQP